MKMDTNSPFGSANFAFVARELVKLHRFFQAGEDDSPATDAIRDALDEPWAALDPVENRRAQYLSADLYDVSEPPVNFKLKEMNPQAEEGINKATQAWNNQQWDLALNTLRRWKSYLSPARLSALRASLWRELGFLDAATMFYEHAFQLEPSNEFYYCGYLICLSKIDLPKARELAKRIMDLPKGQDPNVIVTAANILYEKTTQMDDTAPSDLARQIIPTLRETLAQIETNATGSPSANSVHSMCIVLLASCYRSMGEFAEAAAVLTRGISFAPENPMLAKLQSINSSSHQNLDSHNLQEFNQIANEILRCSGRTDFLTQAA